jgi:carbamoyltransferase
LNICANSLLQPLFKNIHIPSFTNDSGIAFGLAAWGSFRSNERVEIPDNLAFLGKSYEDFTPDPDVCEYYEYYEDFDELCELVADILEKENKVVGWFQGRSEHGPRALGNRSILMSPKRSENKDIMNNKVKHREPWRPFAGIVLENKVSDYFVEGDHTPYMLYSQTVKSDKIPAITHNDKSCRIQTVNEKINPRICKLLSKLEDPILLNTSFNYSGEPIVETPEDAINTFFKTKMDYLVIGNYLIWN